MGSVCTSRREPHFFCISNIILPQDCHTLGGVLFNPSDVHFSHWLIQMHIMSHRDHRRLQCIHSKIMATQFNIHGKVPDTSSYLSVSINWGFINILCSCGTSCFSIHYFLSNLYVLLNSNWFMRILDVLYLLWVGISQTHVEFNNIQIRTCSVVEWHHAAAQNVYQYVAYFNHAFILAGSNNRNNFPYTVKLEGI